MDGDVKHKRGDVHPVTGKLFWLARKDRADEWVTPEQFGRYLNIQRVITIRYRKKNKRKEAAARKRHHEANKEKENARVRKWHKENRDRVRLMARWRRLRNIDTVRPTVAKAQRDKRATDPMYHLMCRLRSRISAALKRRKWRKRSRTDQILGCARDQLRAHIESQFQPGMTWENRQEWHVDHRHPVSTAKTEAEMIALFHYTNLQPLWAHDNQVKSNKIIAA